MMNSSSSSKQKFSNVNVNLGRPVQTNRTAQPGVAGSYGRMTVLGRGRGRGVVTSKVAAPAPINLPSRKSESGGLGGMDVNTALVQGSSGWARDAEPGGDSGGPGDGAHSPPVPWSRVNARDETAGTSTHHQPGLAAPTPISTSHGPSSSAANDQRGGRQGQGLSTAEFPSLGNRPGEREQGRVGMYGSTPSLRPSIPQSHSGRYGYTARDEQPMRGGPPRPSQDSWMREGGGYGRDMDRGPPRQINRGFHEPAYEDRMGPRRTVDFPKRETALHEDFYGRQPGEPSSSKSSRTIGGEDWASESSEQMDYSQPLIFADSQVGIQSKPKVAHVEVTQPARESRPEISPQKVQPVEVKAPSKTVESIDENFEDMQDLSEQKEYMKQIAQSKTEQRRQEEEKRMQEQYANAQRKKAELEKIIEEYALKQKEKPKPVPELEENNRVDHPRKRPSQEPSPQPQDMRKPKPQRYLQKDRPEERPSNTVPVSPAVVATPPVEERKSTEAKMDTAKKSDPTRSETRKEEVKRVHPVGKPYEKYKRVEEGAKVQALRPAPDFKKEEPSEVQFRRGQKPSGALRSDTKRPRDTIISRADSDSSLETKRARISKTAPRGTLRYVAKDQHSASQPSDETKTEAKVQYVPKMPVEKIAPSIKSTDKLTAPNTGDSEEPLSWTKRDSAPKVNFDVTPSFGSGYVIIDGQNGIDQSDTGEFTVVRSKNKEKKAKVEQNKKLTRREPGSLKPRKHEMNPSKEKEPKKKEPETPPKATPPPETKPSPIPSPQKVDLPLPPPVNPWTAIPPPPAEPPRVSLTQIQMEEKLREKTSAQTKSIPQPENPQQQRSHPIENSKSSRNRIQPTENVEKKDLPKRNDVPRRKELQKPSERKHKEHKPSELKPSEQKPIEQKPSEHKPSEHKPSEHKPNEHKPIEQKPSEVHSSTQQQKPERRQTRMTYKVKQSNPEPQASGSPNITFRRVDKNSPTGTQPVQFHVTIPSGSAVDWQTQKPKFTPSSNGKAAFDPKALPSFPQFTDFGLTQDTAPPPVPKPSEPITPTRAGGEPPSISLAEYQNTQRLKHQPAADVTPSHDSPKETKKESSKPPPQKQDRTNAPKPPRQSGRGSGRGRYEPKKMMYVPKAT